MKSKTIFNVSIALAILAGGCALGQLRTQDGPRRAELPRPPMPETTLTNVKLNPGRKIQNLTGMIGRSKQIFNSLIRENGGAGVEQAMSTTTVGALKAQGLFRNSVLSDDSTVVVLDARGGFVQFEGGGDRQRAHNYTRLVAMFDPLDGGLISYGLVP